MGVSNSYYLTDVHKVGLFSIWKHISKSKDLEIKSLTLYQEKKSKYNINIQN